MIAEPELGIWNLGSERPPGRLPNILHRFCAGRLLKGWRGAARVREQKPAQTRHFGPRSQNSTDLSVVFAGGGEPWRAATAAKENEKKSELSSIGEMSRESSRDGIRGARTSGLE